MILANIISSIALVVSIISLIYTWKSNTKKYELSEDIRKELLDWYYNCIKVLVRLRKEIETNRCDEQKMLELNSELYSLIELGRFYFPNYNREKGKGRNSSEAYKGNRPLLIDLLVETHKITCLKKEKRSSVIDYVSELKKYQKGFTSEMFNLIEPDSYISKQIEVTKIKLLHRKTFSESEYAPKNH